MSFSTQYNHHQVPGLTCEEPSMTQQQYLLEADINDIIARYQNGNVTPQTGSREPIFGDFSDEAIGDFHQAMQTIAGLNELMMQLPAKVRSRFQNNPAAVLDFVRDPANIAEARELGLIDAPPEPARVVDTEPPKTSK